MKAIVLWQPWAQFMALGLKQNETRSWPTRHRGELAICASKRKMGAFELHLCEEFAISPADFENDYGKVLCVVDVLDCVPTANFVRSADKALLPLRTIRSGEWRLGDYTVGRYAWVTANLRRLVRPVGVVGRQGLFNLDPGTEVAVRRQL